VRSRTRSAPTAARHAPSRCARLAAPMAMGRTSPPPSHAPSCAGLLWRMGGYNSGADERKITHELSGSLSRKAGWPCPCLEPHRRGSLTTHPGGWGARGLRPWRWLSGTKPTIHSADLYKMRARTLATTARSPSSVPDQGLNVPVRLSQRARWRSIVSSRSSSASSFFVLSRSARALRSAPSAVSTRCDLSLKLSSASNAPPASSAMRR